MSSADGASTELEESDVIDTVPHDWMLICQLAAEYTESAIEWPDADWNSWDTRATRCWGKLTSDTAPSRSGTKLIYTLIQWQKKIILHMHAELKDC